MVASRTLTLPLAVVLLGLWFKSPQAVFNHAPKAASWRVSNHCSVATKADDTRDVPSEALVSLAACRVRRFVDPNYPGSIQWLAAVSDEKLC